MLRNKLFIRFFLCCLALLLVIANFPVDLIKAGSGIAHKTLDNNVECWFWESTPNYKPQIFKYFEGLLHYVFPSNNSLPFGKSVAFLVGVSKYKNNSSFRSLPYVENDLRELKDLLLNKCRFDTVYVVKNEAVDTSLIEDYMFNKFPHELDKHDRLLFYFSGHGKDMGGTTGYMCFSKAAGKFDPINFLEIRRYEQWSKKIPAKHILFIYDCCASGLALSAKSPSTLEASQQFINSLSGNGSRTVITAGIAGEEAYGTDNNSLLTNALVTTLKDKDFYQKDGFLTTNQLFAVAEIKVRKMAEQNNKNQTPRLRELDDSNGTFLFFNNDVKNIQFSPQIEEALHLKGPASTDASQNSNDGPKFEDVIDPGSLTVSLATTGILEFFGKTIEIPAGGSLPIKNLKPGSYTLTVRYPDGQIESKMVDIISGQAANLSFTYVPSKTNNKLIVSNERQEVSVPSLENKTFSEAQNILEAEKLKVEKIEVYNDFIAKGMIVSQAPSSGTKVKVNSVVTVKVSKGTEKVIVPSLIGLYYGTAMNRLNDLKLKTDINRNFSDRPIDTVISQSPAPNTMVMPGTSVVIIVSKGEASIYNSNYIYELMYGRY